MPIKELYRKGGFSDATFYKWRAKYGGRSLDRDAAAKSYSRDFAAMCDEPVSALANLAELLERRPT